MLGDELPDLGRQARGAQVLGGAPLLCGNAPHGVVKQGAGELD
jgi:hypothetical protein